jgi:isoamylase
MSAVQTIRVHAPDASEVHVVSRSCHEPTGESSVTARHEPEIGWIAEVALEPGDLYWIVVDGGPPLLDPHCRALVHTPDGPRSMWREAWSPHAQGQPLATPPVVYELHVRGFGRTFVGCVEHLDHVSSVGANVVELMPVHPFDPSDNYWGYMPLVWGAVHGEFAADPLAAAEELAALVAAVHERGMHVWLDVVFNHTGEGDAAMPTRSLRGLDDRRLYRHRADGSYTDDSGCGNDIDPSHPYVRVLVLEALDRYADLGVDGFRFDLASLLTRDGGELVRQVTEWAERRGVTLVAEPWDLASYQVGSPVWPASWLQWNDRFRDDVRGFLRGEPGLVDAVRSRVAGSTELVPDGSSVNFITAHDGLTMHDLTIVTSDRHRSWDCGPELRVQQLKNYFSMLLLAAGTPMWVMGDEFARTQGGDDNPYNVDGPVSWVDWTRADEWRELTDFVRALTALRRDHPPSSFRFHGVDAEVDTSHESRSLAWESGGLYVMVNAWWEPLHFGFHEPGDWQPALATAPTDGTTLAPRSVAIWRRS